MRKATRSILVASISLLVAVAANPVFASGRNSVKASLDGLQEVPSISTVGEGDLRVKIRGDEVEYELSYEGLEGSVVLFAHIHFGRPAVNGGVMVFLCSNVGAPVATPPCPPAEGGTVEGTLTAGDVIGPAAQGIDPGEFEEFVDALRNEASYVNVHTDLVTSGEIRGDID